MRYELRELPGYDAADTLVIDGDTLCGYDGRQQESSDGCGSPTFGGRRPESQIIASTLERGARDVAERGCDH
jgi:hypothetical protein